MNRIKLAVFVIASAVLPGCLPQSLTCSITTASRTDQIPEILAELNDIQSVEGAVGACAKFVSIRDQEGREVAAERDGLLDAANLIDQISPSLRELSLFVARRSSTLSENAVLMELAALDVHPDELTTQAGRNRIRTLIADRAPVYGLHARFTAASTAIRGFCQQAYKLRAQARVTREEVAALMELRAALVGRFSELRSLLDGPTFEQIHADHCADGEGETESAPIQGTVEASRAPRAPTLRRTNEVIEWRAGSSVTTGL